MKWGGVVILVMGGSGAGETAIGRRLADEMGWEVFHGEDFPPGANLEKMGKGPALTDAPCQPPLGLLPSINNPKGDFPTWGGRDDPIFSTGGPPN